MAGSGERIDAHVLAIALRQVEGGEKSVPEELEDLSPIVQHGAGHLFEMGVQDLPATPNRQQLFDAYQKLGFKALTDAGEKANGFPQMPGPVAWIHSLFRLNPSSGHIRNKWDRGGVELNLSDLTFK